MKSPVSSSPGAGPATSALNHALVATFLENVPDHVYFKDLASRFIAVSRSFADRHGMQPVALIGRTDFEIFSEAHARRAHEDEQSIIHTGQPLLDKLEKETWPDGRVTWVVTHKLPLRSPGGAIIGTFGISKDVTATKQTEAALERAQQELLDASRLAGMAEVATGVLHNVGNALNSLNISASVIADGIRQSKTVHLAKLAGLLREHASDLGDFLERDPKGRLVPEFIGSLSDHALEERSRLLAELESLQKNIDHIKEIVAMQQSFAKVIGVSEPLDPIELFEDALRMNSAALVRHDVRVIREFQPVPHVYAEKGKVLQILVNLIRNAKYALDEHGAADKVTTLRVEPGAPGRVRLVVQDNGVGIPTENLTRIFAHGFTTRAHGHGFGLHSSALAAGEMQGSIQALSEGPGTGATFVLELPEAHDTSATPGWKSTAAPTA